MTIADISIVPSVTTAKVTWLKCLGLKFETNLTFLQDFGFDFRKYPNLNAWHDRMEKLLPDFEENVKGSQMNVGFIIRMIGGPIFQF